MANALAEWLAANGHDRVVALQTALTHVPALAPENGGSGEWAKARVVQNFLKDAGVADVEFINSPDVRVPEGTRPNIVARIPGRTSRTLWIMGHMDVVPAGEPGLWHTDPFVATVDGGRIYGRGTEDNQQAIVSMLLLAEALAAGGHEPEHGLGMLFVADEECGSQHGMEYVLAQRRDLFRDGDLVVVPDMGVPDGTLVEIAEKGVLWLKVEVKGTQCHGSEPEKGRNTLVAAADMIMHVADVAAGFPATDDLFKGGSTFAPTRHEANVMNVNTVPGRDVFYVDCRIMPCYGFDEVLDTFRHVFGDIAAKHGVAVELSTVQESPATEPTPKDAPVVRSLLRAIHDVLHVVPECVGVGGATVAATFRRAGIPAAVWGTQDGTMHGPNEYSVISHAVGDAMVLADMLCRPVCDA